MSGRPLNNVRAVPAVLLRHLGSMLDIETLVLASLRALRRRRRGLMESGQGRGQRTRRSETMISLC